MSAIIPIFRYMPTQYNFVVTQSLSEYFKNDTEKLKLSSIILFFLVIFLSVFKIVVKYIFSEVITRRIKSLNTALQHSRFLCL